MDEENINQSQTVNLENVMISHLDCTTKELSEAIKYINAENKKVDEVANEVEEIRVELVNQEIIADKNVVEESIENETVVEQHETVKEGE